MHSTPPRPAGLVGRRAPSPVVAVTKLDLSAEDAAWAEQGVERERTRWLEAYSLRTAGVGAHSLPIAAIAELTHSMATPARDAARDRLPGRGEGLRRANGADALNSR